jgi:WD40 repeat protein
LANTVYQNSELLLVVFCPISLNLQNTTNNTPSTKYLLTHSLTHHPVHHLFMKVGRFGTGGEIVTGGEIDDAAAKTRAKSATGAAQQQVGKPLSRAATKSKLGEMKKTIRRQVTSIELHDLFYNRRLYSSQYVTVGNDGQVCLWSLELNTMPLHHVRINKKSLACTALTFKCPDMDLGGDGIQDFGNSQIEALHCRTGTSADRTLPESGSDSECDSKLMSSRRTSQVTPRTTPRSLGQMSNPLLEGAGSFAPTDDPMRPLRVSKKIFRHRQGSYGLCAVGCTDGSVVVMDLPSLTVFVCRHVVKTLKGGSVLEGITDVKYSPSGEKLACCSSDQCIYVLDASPQLDEHGQRTGDPYPIIAKCKGHTATVETVDWSADCRFLRSACAAAEILYWDAATGGLADARKYYGIDCDVAWATETSKRGFAVMGIWPREATGNDINACDVSVDRKLIGQ